MGTVQPEVNTLLTVRRVGRREGDPQNHFEIKGYTKVDLHVGVAFEQVEAYVWADNLTNQKYQLYANYYTDGVIAGMPGRGRIIGAGARIDF